MVTGPEGPAEELLADELTGGGKLPMELLVLTELLELEWSGPSLALPPQPLSKPIHAASDRAIAVPERFIKDIHWKDGRRSRRWCKAPKGDISFLDIIRYL